MYCKSATSTSTVCIKHWQSQNLTWAGGRGTRLAKKGFGAQKVCRIPQDVIHFCHDVTHF